MGLSSSATNNISISFPVSLLSELNNTQNRTNETRLEEFFCLVGTDTGLKKDRTSPPHPSQITVNHIVKPTQARYLGYKLMGDEAVFVSQVEQKAPCPPGTIGDVHSHPWKGEPSKYDIEGWIQRYAFANDHRFHAVTSKVRGKKENQIRFYVVHCSKIEKRRAKCGLLEIMPDYDVRLTIGPAL